MYSLQGTCTESSRNTPIVSLPPGKAQGRDVQNVCTQHALLGVKPAPPSFYAYGNRIKPSMVEILPLSLRSGDDFAISPTIRKLRFGMEWDKGVDIDVAAVLFDTSLTAVDVVSFKKLKSDCRSVVHSGDSLTGNGKGDDESIDVNFNKISHDVHHVVFFVCIHTYDILFSDIRRAYVRVINTTHPHEPHVLCAFALSQDTGHASIVAQLTRKGAFWNFRALGVPATGRSPQAILRNVQNLDCLMDCPSLAPVFRYVDVRVVRGTGLAAKDRSLPFGQLTTSDPYYVIRYNGRKFISDHRFKTLSPDWNDEPFVVGHLTESDTKKLKIAFFDYDALSSHEFMGCIQVHANTLYNMGPGQHEHVMKLQHSTKSEFKRECITGEVHLEIRIQEIIPIDPISRMRV